MKVRTAFLSLLTLSFLAILTLVLGTRLLHAADDGNAQTPYIDTAAAGVPAPSGCSPMFQIPTLLIHPPRFVDGSSHRRG